jgi:formylglycine-generating enzyme
MRKLLQAASVLCFLLLAIVSAQAVTIDMATVGNPGNENDPPQKVYGSVAYNYQIGKFEITVGQYCEFLNAVAKTADPYGLYNTNMATYTKIGREWRTDHYDYSVSSDWANRPVNLVSWGDSARFVNWLSNGQPKTGFENLSTTEDGSYYLNGAITNDALQGVTRKSNATWVIPSDNEWYEFWANSGDTIHNS